ncbi:hypothetical protein CEXT_415201 [Caerostris extrusa]|uniref:Uncharacterized protein n=1 Tax=Caerostris extrusa TaxID=172846 RepID=A0AAV4Y7R2_CAEEX|nr:hypothetical protein CEXT_415201 [Caerostris extrusa]
MLMYLQGEHFSNRLIPLLNISMNLTSERVLDAPFEANELLMSYGRTTTQSNVEDGSMWNFCKHFRKKSNPLLQQPLMKLRCRAKMCELFWRARGIPTQNIDTRTQPLTSRVTPTNTYAKEVITQGNKGGTQRIGTPYSKCC